MKIPKSFGNLEKGLVNALRRDWNLTLERNPNLARAHECGVGAFRYANQMYRETIEDTKTSAERNLKIFLYSPIRAFNSLTTYPLGVVLGAFGATPEGLGYVGESQGGEQ
ncbi:MAG TPA: hypothetical protein ENH99_02580 [Candidatus Pacearchaeota archaeon]|nr:hypothetical protein [Candidatus Pacearchaeota archaeon]